MTAAAAELNKTEVALQPNAPEAQVAALALTRGQWVELVEAIASKKHQVSQGNYGNAPDTVDAVKWADDLEKLFQAVSSALEDQGITL